MKEQCNRMYPEYDINNMLVETFLSGMIFQQIVCIPMGINDTPLLADIFLYSYEGEFMQSLFSTGKKQ